MLGFFVPAPGAGESAACPLEPARKNTAVAVVRHNDVVRKRCFIGSFSWDGVFITSTVRLSIGLCRELPEKPDLALKSMRKLVQSIEHRLAGNPDQAAKWLI